MKTSNRDRWASGFYWLGVVLTVASVALVVFNNTKWGAAVQHTSFPLAWKFAIVAVLSFLVGELCHPAFHLKHDADRSDRHSLDHTPYEI